MTARAFRLWWRPGRTLWKRRGGVELFTGEPRTGLDELITRFALLLAVDLFSLLV